jgi:shikimate kinase
MKVFLLGLPGSGKTTLGKALAEDLQLLYLDLDGEIEKSEGQSVQHIFEIRKEEYFREVEARILQRFCESAEHFVMAVGGGAPCFYDNLERMNVAGTSIFLDVSESEIVARLVKTNLDERPLLANLSADELLQKIKTLRAKRLDFYTRAHFTLRGDALMISDLSRVIKSGQQ